MPSEVKYFDDSLPWTELVNTALLNDVTEVTQGVGTTQRVGDELKVVALDLRYAAAVTTGGATVPALARIIVFQWLQDTAATAPTLATVLLNTGTASDYPLSPYNADTVRSGYLGVLYDRTFGVSNLLPVAEHVRISVNKHIRFNAAATTGTGKIYIMYLSDQAASNATDGSYVCRTVFDDN